MCQYLLVSVFTCVIVLELAFVFVSVLVIAMRGMGCYEPIFCYGICICFYWVDLYFISIFNCICICNYIERKGWYEAVLRCVFVFVLAGTFVFALYLYQHIYAIVLRGRGDMRPFRAVYLYLCQLVHLYLHKYLQLYLQLYWEEGVIWGRFAI